MKALRTHWTLYLLVSTFLIPLVLSYWKFYMEDHSTLTLKHSGELLSPPLPLMAYPNSPLTLNQKWHLVYIEPASYSFLDEDTQERLALLEHIKLTIGKEAYRLDTMAIPSSKIPLLTEGDIAVVDPKGWLILYYPPQSDPKSIVKDLKRLLRNGHA